MKTVKQLFLLILTVFSATSGVQAAEISKSQEMRFNQLCQHFCYIATETIQRMSKNQAVIRPNQTQQKLVQDIKQKLPQLEQRTRELLYKNHSASRAIHYFGDTLLHLMPTTLFNQVVPNLENSFDTTTSIDEQLDCIELLINDLQTKYNEIKPSPTLRQRFEGIFLYNSFSTKILPATIRTLGSMWSVIAFGMFIYAQAIADSSVFDKLTNELPEDKFSGEFVKKVLTNFGSVMHDNIWNKFATHPVSYSAGILAGSIPTLILPTLAQWIEDKQIYEFEHRIKKAQEKSDAEQLKRELYKEKTTYETRVNLKDIIGICPEVNQLSNMAIDFMNNPFKYTSKSGTVSMLLHGPPGSGKTLLARAIAKETGAPLVQVTADDMLNPNAKERVKTLWHIAEEAAANRPNKSAIIYFDEIDCVVTNREKGINDVERSKALSNLLTILDGVEGRNPYIHILVIMTSNHPENLDPALLRPGRIDYKMLIGYPNDSGRSEFFKKLLPSENLELVDYLVSKTENFSGARIAALIESAHNFAAFNDRLTPTKEDYDMALKQLAK